MASDGEAFPNPTAAPVAPRASPLRTSAPKRSFVSLPAEIRLQVYGYFLPTGATVVLPRCNCCRKPEPERRERRPSRVSPRAWRSSPRDPTPAPGCPATSPAYLVRPNPIHPEMQRNHWRACRFCCRAPACQELDRVMEAGREALKSVLALMGACRAVYGDVVEVFYRGVMFRMHWVDFAWLTIHRSPVATPLLSAARRLCLVWDLADGPICGWQEVERATLELETSCLRELVVEASKLEPLESYLLTVRMSRGTMPGQSEVRGLENWRIGSWYRERHEKWRGRLNKAISAFETESVALKIETGQPPLSRAWCRAGSHRSTRCQFADAVKIPVSTTLPH